MKANPESVDAAKQQALYFLKFRSRSEEDLRRRLARKGFTPAAVEPALARLKELGLVDDQALARGLVERGRQADWGENRLRQTLRLRGLPRDTAAEALSVDPEEPESVRAKRALERRAKRLPADLDPRARYRRLAGHLARQGFAPDAVRDALEGFFRGSDGD